MEVVEPREPFQQEKVDAGSQQDQPLQSAEIGGQEDRRERRGRTNQQSGKRLERQRTGIQERFGGLCRTAEPRAEAERGGKDLRKTWHGLFEVGGLKTAGRKDVLRPAKGISGGGHFIRSSWTTSPGRVWTSAQILRPG